MRIRATGYDSEYIGFTIPNNLTSTDNVMVKIDNGNYLVRTIAPYKYHDLPIASKTRLGIIQVGDNLTIDSSGKLSSTGGGLAATVTVGTTTTGEAGTNASVTNSGTAQAAVLNFVIPKGANGSDGADGIDGTDGREIELQVTDTYIQWRYIGDTIWYNLIPLSELKGAKGDKGDTGSVGASNTLTIGTVTKGENAEATITGTSPNQVLNLVLPKGDQGEQGIQGKDGNSGVYIGTEEPTDSSVNVWIDSDGLSEDYDGLPVGTIVPYSSSTIPVGYLLCDGSELSRTEYIELFNVLGTSYNLETDTDETKFRLPNLKGKVPVGLDNSDTDFNLLGKTGGEKKHTLTIEEIPSHNHTATIVKSAALSLNNVGFSGWNENNNGIDTTSSQINNTGGGQDHNNLQPYITLNYIIKASGTTILKGNVVNNLTDNSTENAPSQYAVNEALLDTYSTEEVKTNKVWIDGKTIYRRVFEIGDLEAGTEHSVDLNVTDLNIIVNMWGFISIPDNNFSVPINFYNYGESRGHYCFYDKRTNKLMFKSSWGATGLYIILEYTKTTDTV